MDMGECEWCSNDFGHRPFMGFRIPKSKTKRPRQRSIILRGPASREIHGGRVESACIDVVVHPAHHVSGDPPAEPRNRRADFGMAQQCRRMHDGNRVIRVESTGDRPSRIDRSSASISPAVESPADNIHLPLGQRAVHERQIHHARLFAEPQSVYASRAHETRLAVPEIRSRTRRASPARVSPAATAASVPRAARRRRERESRRCC